MNDAPTRGDALLDSLDDAQRAAANSTASRVVVSAAPGSGKTRVLAARVVTLVRLRGVKPREIAAFAFTREAASELRGRIADSIGAESAADVGCSTLHGFAAGVLMRVLGGGRRVADEDEEEEILRGFVDGPERNPVGRKLGITALRDAVERYGAGLGEPRDTAAVTLLHLRFQKRLLFARWQLIPNAVGILAGLVQPPGGSIDAEVAAERERVAAVRHVLVDEAQDLTPGEAALIACFSRARLFAVLDPDQAIYGWRHAEAKNLWPLLASGGDRSWGPPPLMPVEGGGYVEMPSAPSGAAHVERHNLSRSYRFGPRIAAAATAWIGREPPLVGTSRADDEARCFDNATVGVGLKTHVDRLWRRHGEGHVAVLCRTNDECAAAVRELGDVAVHVTRNTGPNERLIREAIRLARFVVNPRDDSACAALARASGLGEKIAEWKAKAGVRPLFLQAPYGWHPIAMAADYAESVESVPWGRVVAATVDALRPHGFDRAPFLDAALMASESFAGPNTPLEAALEAYRQRTEESGFDAASRACKVAVATVHAAKGREWDAVVLSVRPTGAIDSEEKRVWYVAMTRARRELVIL